MIDDLMAIRATHLINTMTQSYGADKANKAWNALLNELDDDELGIYILSKMLSGEETGDHIIFTEWNGNNKIAAIRAFRRWTKDTNLSISKKQIEKLEFGQSEPFLLDNVDDSVVISPALVIGKYNYDYIRQDCIDSGLIIKFV